VSDHVKRPPLLLKISGTHKSKTFVRVAQRSRIVAVFFDPVAMDVRYMNNLYRKYFKHISLKFIPVRQKPYAPDPPGCW
jgi:hypothetical protein